MKLEKSVIFLDDFRKFAERISNSRINFVNIAQELKISVSFSKPKIIIKCFVVVGLKYPGYYLFPVSLCRNLNSYSLTLSPTCIHPNLYLDFYL